MPRRIATSRHYDDHPSTRSRFPKNRSLGRLRRISSPRKVVQYLYNDFRSATPWGDTRPDFGRGEVRQYLRDNAAMWLDDYRADGLRWDSTVNIRSGGGADIPEGWSFMKWVNSQMDPWKIAIAEDLRNDDAILWKAGFDAQWDASFVHPVRQAIVAAKDADRSMAAVKAAIQRTTSRVVYTESHDEVANGKARVAEEIWPGNAASWYSKKRSTLGAALVLTSPGIPMVFQGQELLEDGWFQDTDPVDWNKLALHGGIRDLYRDLIKLRRTLPGLRGPGVNVHHVNDADKVIAFHRWDQGGAGDDVVVVANFSAKPFASYAIGMPRGGSWRVRFNSDAKGYSPDFGDAPSFDKWASSGAKDGMNFHANVGVGPYSVVILTQDP